MTKDTPTNNRRLCRPGDQSDNVELDPEFEQWIPPLSSRELADLHRSLDADGCLDALVLWKGQNTLVDGHNRIHHCREKGYSFPVVEREFADRDEVKAFIAREHLGRRNLSSTAESYFRGKRYLVMKRQGVRTDLTSGHSDQKSAAERLGEEYKVAEKTIRRDGKLAEAVDQIEEHCGPGTRNLILARDTGLSRNGVLRLAELDPEEQRTFIEELRRAGKRPRKSRKGRKRETITVPLEPGAMVRALLEYLSPEESAEVSRGLADGAEQQKEGERRDGGVNGSANEKGMPRKGTAATTKPTEVGLAT